MTDQPELELQELLGLVNDELTVALRAQPDDTLPVQKSDAREDLGRHICIELAGRQLAIPMAAVIEAGELHSVQSLPLLPEWLTGITNIRGEIISVVNLAFFLGFATTSSGAEGFFLIVRDDRLKVAITVDRVIGTRSLYRCSSTENREQSEDAMKQQHFSAGRACYEEQGREKCITLLGLNDFLSSQKLRNVATV